MNEVRTVLISFELSRENPSERPLAQFSLYGTEEDAARRIQDEQSSKQNKSETAGKSMTLDNIRILFIDLFIYSRLRTRKKNRTSFVQEFVAGSPAKLNVTNFSK